MTLSSEVITSLDDLDIDWQLIPIDSRKRPVDPRTGKPREAWAAAATDIAGIRALAASPHVHAVGVVLGPQSGGLLAVDFDGPDSDLMFRSVYGRSAQELPRTVAWSSGRPSRRQMAFYVPREYWDDLRGRRSWNHDGSNALELRWLGHQSVIAGAHPDTSGYHWVSGCSPSELQTAAAPDWLLEPLFKLPDEPAHTNYAPSAEDYDRAKELLGYIKPRDGYDGWLKVGMALHSVDTALLDSWVEWSEGSSNFNESECHQKWRSFKKSGITIGSLVHLARLDGWTPPRRAPRSGPLDSAGPEDHYRQHDQSDQPLSPPEIAAQRPPRIMPRTVVREHLTAAYEAGIALADRELLIAELADASEQHPAALRMLFQAIQHDMEQAQALQAEQESLAAGLGVANHQGLRLDQLFPEELARALMIASRAMPYVDHAVAVAYLAGISGLVKLGTNICGNVITNYVVPCNLYVATVAKSGQKKTPLEKLAIRNPTREIRADIARQNTLAMDNWREQCREIKKADDRPQKPTALHVQVQDYTGEALTALLQESEKHRTSVLVLRDELAGLFGTLNAYRSGRGGDEQQLLELFDGGSFTSLRVSTSDRGFERCHVSIYGGIQPDVLRDLIKGGDPTGKWARFLFSPLPPITAPLPTSVTPADIGLAEDADRTLLEYARKIFTLSPNTYSLAADAVAHFSAFEHGKQQQALDARIAAQGALYGKTAGKVLRVAGLLHVIRVAAGSVGTWDPISLGILQLSIDLVEHLDTWALRFHELAVGDVSLPAVSTLMRRIHQRAENVAAPIGWPDVSRSLTASERKASSSELGAAAMEALAQLGLGVLSKTPRGALRYQATAPLPF